MSEKQSKGYDPTLLRAVGNILAGDKDFHTGTDDIRINIENAAIQSVLRVRKKLSKLWKEEGRE